MADVNPTLQPAAPSPEAVDALFELLGSAVRTMMQGRSLRAAEYFGRVVADACAMWRYNGALCVVLPLLMESDVLGAHANVTGVLNNATPLWLKAQYNVAECRHILNARLSDNTCFFGRCFEVEEDFYDRYKAIYMETTRGQALTSAERALLSTTKSEVGEEACMEAAYRGLQFAYPAASFFGVLPPPLTGQERIKTQAFALRCVGLMETALQIYGTFERRFAKQIHDLLTSDDLEQPFKTALTHAWNRPALQNALRARGVIEVGDAKEKAFGKKKTRSSRRRRLPTWQSTAFAGARFHPVPSRRCTCLISRRARRARRLCTAALSTRHCIGRGATRRSALFSKRRGPSRAARRTGLTAGEGRKCKGGDKTL